MVGSYGWLLALWLVLGIGYSTAQTPSGRLLRRSAHAPDRPAVFAAQFALSHACWLICYPLAGYLGATAGITVAFVAMAGIALVGVALAGRLWPAGDPSDFGHDHPGLPFDHPHLVAFGPTGQHHHPVVIDELHARWPSVR